MARKKVEPLFKEWNQVDEALKQIAKIEQTLKINEAKLNQDINSIKTRVQAEAKPLLEEKQRLEKNIREFTEANVNEFTDKKSKDFTYGQVGFRKTSTLVTRNVKAILEALKNNKMFNCITVKESINKDELDKYDDESLAKIGAKRKIEDKFFYKIDEERIEN